MPNINVKNSGHIHLELFKDKDGNLVVGEVGKHIPFDIKRFYFINNISDPSSIRGRHAHKNLEQYIFSVQGAFTLDLDDGQIQQSIRLDTPGHGIRLGKLLWHTMRDFTPDNVILVVASDLYNEDDYIRDYETFLKHANSLQ
jgi:hypothetical protein